MTPDEAAWLTAPAGRAAVKAATEAGTDPLVATTALRASGLSAPESALALTQARLRARAVDRLGPGLAARLLLTPDGLEQATRPVVARRRAARIAASGARHVLDAGCGLGLDALAFAEVNLIVTAVERDSGVATLARANLSGTGARVVAGDITDEDVKRGALAGVDAAFVDPARRDPAGPRHHDGRARRVSNPELWSPPWSWVAALTSRVPRVVAKLAPGVPRDLAPGWELVWTSVGGHLVEAAAWAPALAREGVSRAAVVLRPGADTAEMTDDDDPFGEDELGGMAPTGPVGAYVLEPDDAVIRAGLVGALVASTGGWLLDPRLAYVSCDSEPDGVARLTSRAYRVLEVGPADVRNLRATVTRLGAGDVVIKQRGMRVDPVQLRRALRLTGDGPRLTVLLARIDSGAVAMVASPVPTAHLGRSPSN